MIISISTIIVGVTFPGIGGNSFITTYLRLYGSRGQVLWTGGYNGPRNSMRIYCGTNVYRISAKASKGSESVSITGFGNCSVR